MIATTISTQTLLAFYTAGLLASAPSASAYTQRCLNLLPPPRAAAKNTDSISLASTPGTMRVIYRNIKSPAAVLACHSDHKSSARRTFISQTLVGTVSTLLFSSTEKCFAEEAESELSFQVLYLVLFYNCSLDCCTFFCAEGCDLLSGGRRSERKTLTRDTPDLQKWRRSECR